jgi:hypothetical protein
MDRKKFGIAYSITGNYVKKTLPSLLSVLDNNANCEEETQVDIKVFFYIQNIDTNELKCLEDLCDKYKVPLEVIDSQECIDALERAGDVAYNDSLVIDLYVVAPSRLDVDYNVLFLQSDVVLNHGKSLYDMAVYDFNNGKKSCASTIDLQSSPMIKGVIPLKSDEHLFNDGVFLTSPRLYKEHHTFEQYAESVKEKGWKFYPYWNVLRSGYGLRNELCVLPIKYQIYPAQKMMKISQWIKIFGLKKADYYKKDEIENALEDPIFIHYINFIVKKPWNRDIPFNYRKERAWPYQEIWNHYADKLGIREELLENWEKTPTEKIKRIFYAFIRPVYVLLCTYFYKKEVKNRNSIINSLTENDRYKITGK